MFFNRFVGFNLHSIDQIVRLTGPVSTYTDNPTAWLCPAFNRCRFATTERAYPTLDVWCKASIMIHAIDVMFDDAIACHFSCSSGGALYLVAGTSRKTSSRRETQAARRYVE